MVFLNEKINKYLQDLYHYTDEEVSAMKYMYMDTINRLILDECLLYAEKNNLKEYDEIVKKMRDIGPLIAKQTELLKLVFALPGKYPELEKHLYNEIGKVDSELMGELTAGMSEKDAIGLLELMKEDVDKMERFTDKYLSRE